MAEDKKLKVTLICYPQEDDCYTVICPEINRATQGDTIEEAKFMMKELIDDYFENVEENEYSKADLIDIYNRGDKVIVEMTV